MKNDVTALRRHSRRVCGMLTDHQCVGELLLVGLALARTVDLEDPWPVTEETNLADFGPYIYGQHLAHHHSDLLAPVDDSYFSRAHGYATKWGRVATVVAADIRRYVPPSHNTRGIRCARPRIKTVGLCDRAVDGFDTELLTNLVDGTQTRIGSCKNVACKKWLADTVYANRRDAAANPPPRPPANTGGVLDRHIPEIDWYSIYRALDPRWKPPPEGQPMQLPRLKLIVTPDPQTSTPVRPPLTRVDTPRHGLQLVGSGVTPDLGPKVEW